MAQGKGGSAADPARPACHLVCAPCGTEPGPQVCRASLTSWQLSAGRRGFGKVSPAEPLLLTATALAKCIVLIKWCLFI